MLKQITFSLALIASIFASSMLSAADEKYVTKDEVGEIVKKYLMDNPEVIIQSFESYQQKQIVERQNKAKEALDKRKNDIYNNTSSPVIGNTKGDVAVVYFFDYNCGFCKKTYPTITKLIEDDKNVKVILKEFPILGQSSELAAKYAIAVNMIDKAKYSEYHAQLMKFTGEKNDASLTDLAKKIGIKEDKLKETLSKKEVSDYIASIRNLAMDLGIQGTPAFIVGNDLIPGAVDAETLKERVKAIRAATKK